MLADQIAEARPVSVISPKRTCWISSLVIIGFLLFFSELATFSGHSSRLKNQKRESEEDFESLIFEVVDASRILKTTATRH